MSARIDRLQDRARGDLQALRDNASAHASNLTDRMPEPLAGAPDRVSEHPLSYMAGGFGAGVVLGMLTPKVGTVTGVVRRNGHESQNGHSQNGNGSSSGLIGTITGAISGTAMASVKEAVQPLVDDAIAGLRGDERSPEERARANGR
jgi:hypothetical protein